MLKSIAQALYSLPQRIFIYHETMDGTASTYHFFPLKLADHPESPRWSAFGSSIAFWSMFIFIAGLREMQAIGQTLFITDLKNCPLGLSEQNSWYVGIAGVIGAAIVVLKTRILIALWENCKELVINGKFKVADRGDSALRRAELSGGQKVCFWVFYGFFLFSGAISLAFGGLSAFLSGATIAGHMQPGDGHNNAGAAQQLPVHLLILAFLIALSNVATSFLFQTLPRLVPNSEKTALDLVSPQQGLSTWTPRQILLTVLATLFSLSYGFFSYIMTDSADRKVKDNFPGSVGIFSDEFILAANILSMVTGFVYAYFAIGRDGTKFATEFLPVIASKLKACLLKMRAALIPGYTAVPDSRRALNENTWINHQSHITLFGYPRPNTQAENGSYGAAIPVSLRQVNAIIRLGGYTLAGICDAMASMFGTYRTTTAFFALSRINWDSPSSHAFAWILAAISGWFYFANGGRNAVEDAARNLGMIGGTLEVNDFDGQTYHVEPHGLRDIALQTVVEPTTTAINNDEAAPLLRATVQTAGLSH